MKETHHASACKPGWIRFVDNSLYWVLLLLAILANFVISVTLVPFLMTMRGFFLYFILLVIAITFGFLFSQILHALEYLQARQHLIIGILIPAIALINLAILTLLSNKLIGILELTTPAHNPWIVAVVYVIGYSLPELLENKSGRRMNVSVS